MADLASSSTKSRDGSAPNIAVRAAGKLAGVDQAAWDALDHGPSPFLKFGFLRALEDSGSIGGRSGWTPVYLMADLGGTLEVTRVGERGTVLVWRAPLH